MTATVSPSIGSTNVPTRPNSYFRGVAITLTKNLAEADRRDLSIPPPPRRSLRIQKECVLRWRSIYKQWPSSSVPPLQFPHPQPLQRAKASVRHLPRNRRPRRGLLTLRGRLLLRRLVLLRQGLLLKRRLLEKLILLLLLLMLRRRAERKLLLRRKLLLSLLLLPMLKSKEQQKEKETEKT